MKKNIYFIFFGWIIPVFIFFLLTPYLITYLGNEAFGLFTLINVVTGYVSFINFGFGQAVTKYIAEYKANNFIAEINKVVIISISFFTIIGLIGLVFIFFSSTFAVTKIFNISLNLRDTAIITFKIGGLGFLLNMLTEVLRGLSIGLNNFFLPNLFRSTRVILSSVFMVYAVVNGGELHHIMIGNILGQFIVLSFNILFTLKLFKPFKYIFDINLMRNMFKYSKYIFISKSLNFTASEIGILLLGIIKNSAEITFYTVPKRLISRSLEILNRFFEILFPLSSKLSAQNKVSDLIRIYFSMFKFQILIVIPIIIIVAFHGKWFLGVWISEQFSQNCYHILLISCLTGLVSMMTNLPSYYAMGLGFPEYTTRFTIYRLILILISIFPLTNYYGYTGVALSMLLGEIQGLFFIFYVPRKIFKQNLPKFIKNYIFKSTVIVLIFSLLYLNFAFYIHELQIIKYQILILISLLSLYVLLLFILNLLSVNEIKRIISNVKKT
tara:strand:+ start:1124 stop:2611 length:1488 start_codon:yes stop_codon:yes gene_type:complete